MNKSILFVLISSALLLGGCAEVTGVAMNAASGAAGSTIGSFLTKPIEVKPSIAQVAKIDGAQWNRFGTERYGESGSMYKYSFEFTTLKDCTRIAYSGKAYYNKIVIGSYSGMSGFFGIPDNIQANTPVVVSASITTSAPAVPTRVTLDTFTCY